VIRSLVERYDEVARFDPLRAGASWSEYGGRIMYDMGDTWYLPNQGIHRVSRPGPEVRIFRRRD
jgi:hypothetical protein